VTDMETAHDEREELRVRIAGWMDGPLDLLAIVLLCVLVAEFATELPPAWSGRLDALNWFIYSVFTSYFVVQFLLAPEKGRYLRQNWLAAISVLLPAFRLLRVIRVLRATRALRGVRLVRVLTATNRGTRSLNRALRVYQFGRMLALTTAVVAVGAAALVYFERDAAEAGAVGYADALWWTLGFVTTIGSEFQPRTLEGRVVTLLLVVWGLGVFGYVTGAVASYFVGQTGEDKIDGDIADLRREVGDLKAMLDRALEERPGS